MQCLASGKVYPAVASGALCDLTKNTSTILLSPYRPVFTSYDIDLVLKLTHSGVTFLKPADRKRWYKQRYIGSKSCAIDENGQLWAKASELKNHEKELQRLKELKEGKGTKKRVGVPPNSKMLLVFAPPGADLNSGAISDLLPDRQNLPTDVEKNLQKTRKKSYKVDKGKVRQRIYTYINTMKGSKRLFFWTVSFPEGTPDSVCYQAFNTWLTKLRQVGMLREYLWIAERQKGDRLTDKTKAPTNTIHFHIAIPHFMDVHKANAMMGGTLKGLAKRGLMPGACTTVSKAPSLRKTHYLPCIARYNGVDICKHKVTRKPINFAVKKGSRALAHYLTKYVTKNDAGQVNNAGEVIEPGFDHLAWHCSRGFSRLFTAITCTLTEFKQAGLGGYLNRTRTFDMEYVTFVPWLYGPPPLLLDHLYKLNSHIQKLFDNEQPGQTTGAHIR